LYEVSITYAGDTWTERVGFRDLRVVGQDICLNGRPLYLKGVSQHEDSVEGGRSLTEADIRHNFTLARELGCAYVRLAHYPHARAAARIADELGLLLWEEIPVYWAIDFANPATAADAHNQLAELIARDRNRASVVIWSVGNENPDTDDRLAFMTTLARLAKALDPTRLTSAACLTAPDGEAGPVIADRLAEAIDIIGLNEYYGWYNPDFADLTRLFENSRPDKPVIVSEFGADAVAGRRGPDTELFTEDHQLAVYRQQLSVLRTVPYVKGLSPWILYDFRCPRRLGEHQGYYNRKGLLDATRTKRKLAYGALRAYYAER
jgi:beta-glucuronidase